MTPFLSMGAFKSGQGQRHWDTAKELALRTDYTI